MKTDGELIQMAFKQKEKAYAPYSDFHVGAIVEMEDGSLYGGCNIENASYGATRCAEQVAILKAVEDGKRQIKRIAIAADVDDVYPCGICRQVIREFGQNARILIGNHKTGYREHTLEELLPHSFGPSDLEVNENV